MATPIRRVDTGGENIPLPRLTGDVLADTLESLRAERLAVSRNGPWVTYSLHGHTLKKQEYMDSLDARILALRVEIVQSAPFEIVSVVR